MLSGLDILATLLLIWQQGWAAPEPWGHGRSPHVLRHPVPQLLGQMLLLLKAKHLEVLGEDVIWGNFRLHHRQMSS